MKNILWNIFVAILLIIAIAGDVKMANSSREFIEAPKQATFNLSRQNVSVNDSLTAENNENIQNIEDIETVKIQK